MELIINHGKPVEPSLAQKAKAKLGGDQKTVVVLSVFDISHIVAESLWKESPWLKRYQSVSATLSHADGSLTMTFKQPKD